MISVSKGERCMRLWNLMTAKKAGVLNFSRDILQEAGESKHSPGEGRNVVWGATEEGDEFCVGFDRDLVVFGMDSTPKCRVMPEPRKKIHEFCYVSTDSTDSSLLAVSTEDGKILFFSTHTDDLSSEEPKTDKNTGKLPVARLVAQLGGREAGVTGRIKAFNLCKVTDQQGDQLIVATGSSDGKVRLFKLSINDLAEARRKESPKQMGKLLGTYDTQNRITCLSGFTMIPREEGVEDSDDGFDDDDEETDDEDEDGEDDDEDEIEDE